MLIKSEVGRLKQLQNVKQKPVLHKKPITLEINALFLLALGLN